MNIAVVALLTAVLAAPVLRALADGSLDPDTAGMRVLLAVACAMVIETVGRRFLQAVEQPQRAAEVGPERSSAEGDLPDTPGRRSTDG